MALTGLTHNEFIALHEAFCVAYATLYPGDKTVEGRVRKRKGGGGRKGQWGTTEQKLVFSLVYLKTYPLQALLGARFGLSQSRANRWLQRLLPSVKHALNEVGVLPSRAPEQLAEQERDQQEAAELIIDGTDRRRQRPKDKVKQALHYSGKHKTHSDKNSGVVNAKTKRVGYLSQTYAGKSPSKRSWIPNRVAIPPTRSGIRTPGFRGMRPKCGRRINRKKATQGDVDSWTKTSQSQALPVCVRVEHALAGVKRSRIVKEVFRNTKEELSDLVMVVACGLLNLRVRYRKRRLRP